MRNKQGFTLIELMAAIAIMAILAAIAYNSYTRYIVRNAEAQVEAKMQSLAMELDRYRSSRLTYRGFLPKKIENGTELYKYDIDDKKIKVSEKNNKYTITLTDLTGNKMSAATGGNWVMHAVPESSASSSIKNQYLFSSTGERCRSRTNNLNPIGKNISDLCSAVGAEPW